MPHGTGMEELLDVVDEHDHVIGQKRRAEIYAKNLPFRAINVFIENDHGQLWIPRRVASKKLFPLCLDMGVAGHVAAGETYEDALPREVREEIGVELNQVTWQFLGYLSPFKDGVSAFQKVYKIMLNEVSWYNPNDFCEYYWLTPRELLQRLEQGDKAKSDLPKLVRIFYKV